MNRLWKTGFVMAWIAGASLVAAGPAVGGDRVASGSLSVPEIGPRFKAGDILIVAADNAKLMVGQQVVSALPKGQRLVVAEVREPWIGAYVALGGQTKAGWLQMMDILPVSGPALPEGGVAASVTGASPSGPQLYTAARPILSGSYGTTPAAVAPTPVYSGATYTERDPYSYGSDDRSQPDPDIHSWKPWMR